MAGLVVLEKMVMLVLLMLVGFLAAKGKWVDESFGQRPASWWPTCSSWPPFWPSVVGMEPLFSGRELVVSVVAVFILFAIGGVLGWICAKLLPCRQGTGRRPGCRCSS